MAGKLAHIDAKPPKPTRASIVDRIGWLDEQLAPLYKFQKEREGLRDVILEWHASDAADQTFSHSGAQYAVDISVCAMERVIAMPKLFKKLGDKLFLSLCKFTLGDLDKQVAPVDQGTFVTTSQTGPRRVKSAPKADLPQAA